MSKRLAKNCTELRLDFPGYYIFFFVCKCLGDCVASVVVVVVETRQRCNADVAVT